MSTETKTKANGPPSSNLVRGFNSFLILSLSPYSLASALHRSCLSFSHHLSDRDFTNTQAEVITCVHTRQSQVLSSTLRRPPLPCNLCFVAFSMGGACHLRGESWRSLEMSYRARFWRGCGEGCREQGETQLRRRALARRCRGTSGIAGLRCLDVGDVTVSFLLSLVREKPVPSFIPIKGLKGEKRLIAIQAPELPRALESTLVLRTS